LQSAEKYGCFYGGAEHCLNTFSKEGDQDVHLIFGDNPNDVDPKYTMNGEVAGLPVTFKQDEEQLAKTRKEALTQLNNYTLCGGKDKPLFVEIKISGRWA
jgi:hypothetical protein